MTGVNGLFSTMDQRFIDRANLLVFYTFEESGSILNKASNYSGQYSGQLIGDSSFYFGPGTGFPTTHRVAIKNTGDYYSSDFSHFFVIQRSGGANDNFFCSLAESGGVFSGYSIASNNAGKLVFGYRDCLGPQSITSEFSLSNASSFAVTKRGNYVSLYQYTPVFNVLESSDGLVNETQVFRSDYADLFFADTAPAGFIKDNYSGFAFNYLYFNQGLSTNQVIDIFSGLYSTIIISGGTTGNSFDECTGFYSIPQEGSIVVSGIASSNFTLTKNGIVMLRSINTTDKILVDYTTGYDNVTWNNQADYDFSKQNFVINPINTAAPIIYLNGQRVISGVTQITGQFCATGRAWSRDYTLSGSKEIVDANNYTPVDTVIYDLPLKHSWQYLYSGTGSVSINTGSGIAVYLNGLRTKDFGLSGPTLTLDQSLVSGDLIAVDYYENGFEKLGEVYTSGFFMTSGAFAPNTSRVYLNGQRQALGIDYLEVGIGTLLQSNPLNLPTGSVVDITTYDLWNL